MVKTEVVGFQEQKIKLEGDLAQFEQASLTTSEDGELPADFLEPLSPELESDDGAPTPLVSTPGQPSSVSAMEYGSHTDNASKPQIRRQFWKAGEFERGTDIEAAHASGCMEHVRVHPRFLHSNATSHKWVLGAVAELLDNAFDELIRGATYVNIDAIKHRGSHMLLIEDNGGGMDPERMRHCMSLGYSAKSKMTNVIGQYGNGFKTSTMRLGADVIVFSCSTGRAHHVSTASIGLLSYTFLRETKQQDIIVPMVDFEVQAGTLEKLVRSSTNDWHENMETIKQWSPFSMENELLNQLNMIGKQGTRIMVYNLWENDQGELELDFDSDPHDIQVRGVNRNPKCIAMAERLPNSKHFLTYRHSLRSYASILYLRLPKRFKMILRGLEIEQHCLVGDLMFMEKHVYKPLGNAQQEDEQDLASQYDSAEMKAVVTVGFVKDAKEHVDVQGFNVYHKNRLIKPFWRVWNSAGSQGRGIIGVLEANFVEPAHDKQGFERTTVLARLEARLLRMQKAYWSSHCHLVGYVNQSMKVKVGKEASDATAKVVTAVEAATVKVATTVAKPIPPTAPPEHKWAQNARPVRPTLKIFTKGSLQRDKFGQQPQGGGTGVPHDTGKLERPQTVPPKPIERLTETVLPTSIRSPLPHNPAYAVTESRGDIQSRSLNSAKGALECVKTPAVDGHGSRLVESLHKMTGSIGTSNIRPTSFSKDTHGQEQASVMNTPCSSLSNVERGNFLASQVQAAVLHPRLLAKIKLEPNHTYGKERTLVMNASNRVHPVLLETSMCRQVDTVVSHPGVIDSYTMDSMSSRVCCNQASTPLVIAPCSSGEPGRNLGCQVQTVISHVQEPVNAKDTCCKSQTQAISACSSLLKAGSGSFIQVQAAESCHNVCDAHNLGPGISEETCSQEQASAMSVPCNPPLKPIPASFLDPEVQDVPVDTSNLEHIISKETDSQVESPMITGSCSGLPAASEVQEMERSCPLSDTNNSVFQSLSDISSKSQTSVVYVPDCSLTMAGASEFLDGQVQAAIHLEVVDTCISEPVSSKDACDQAQAVHCGSLYSLCNAGSAVALHHSQSLDTEKAESLSSKDSCKQASTMNVPHSTSSNARSTSFLCSQVETDAVDTSNVLSPRSHILEPVNLSKAGSASSGTGQPQTTVISGPYGHLTGVCNSEPVSLTDTCGQTQSSLVYEFCDHLLVQPRSFLDSAVQIAAINGPDVYSDPVKSKDGSGQEIDISRKRTGFLADEFQVGTSDGHSDKRVKTDETGPMDIQERFMITNKELSDDCALDGGLDPMKTLKLQLVDMRQQMIVMKKKMEEALAEREAFKRELEEERKQAEWIDSELRKKMRDMVFRMKELEAENTMLHLAQLKGSKASQKV